MLSVFQGNDILYPNQFPDKRSLLVYQHVRAVTCPVVVAAGQPHLGGILDPSSEADLSTLPGWTIARLDTGHDVRRDAPAATRALLVDLIVAAST